MKKNSKPLIYTAVTVLGLSTFMIGCTNQQARRNPNVNPNVGMVSPNYQTTYPNTANNFRGIPYTGYVGNPNSPNYNPNQFTGYVGTNKVPNYNANQYVGDTRNPNYTYRNNMNIKNAGLNNTIRDKCNNLKGVEDTSVAVNGDTCVVAVDPKTTLNKSLKNQIESICKNSDRNIDKVVITQDNDVYNRLQRLGQDIQAGTPITDLNTELQNIFNRLAPNR
ncbi:YhcN/YlaJ family sporulation lipoprotein [Tepidibacter aestuarii]|uniref:YhcN/YlaJ family sporulation lipoprotein n=1 Tax=Tepidibacter aestuarii TaxID=2925782 RepID=UPI0020BFAC9A|nr:YhcN/YlaJ family sporulation lipoprotein [Tepidibacter aestuarii]CAH2213145.1 spore cortex protein [Tepidibacter aestuarii]